MFLYEANTEGTGNFTDFSTNRNGGVVDNLQNSPAQANRIRGVGQGPDGLIYVLTDTGAFARLVPSEANRAPVAAR